MKSGSTGGTQSHIAMSNVSYLLFGAEIALNAALSSIFCWVIWMPICFRSVCMISKVRSPVPRSSGGKITLYDIGWPSAIRRPFGPILKPARFSNWLALARSNGTGRRFEACQVPSLGAMMVLPGEARPSQAVLMICCRSVAYSIASRTAGLSSSRCVVLSGLVLMMKVFIDSDGVVVRTNPARFSAATAVGGVYSPMKSTWLSFSAWIIASSLEKNCSPKPSMCGFGRRAIFGFQALVDRPGRVGCGQRPAVGPLRVRHRVERPGQPVLRLGPASREVGRDLQRGVVLDELRIDVLERHVGVVRLGH